MGVKPSGKFIHVNSLSKMPQKQLYLKLCYLRMF